MYGREIFHTGLKSHEAGSAAIISIVLLAVIGIGAALYQRNQYSLHASILRVNAAREAERKIQSAATLTRMLIATNQLASTDTDLPPTIVLSGSSSPKFYALKPRSGSTPAVMHFRFCDPFKLTDTTFSQSFTQPSVLQPPLLRINPDTGLLDETGGCANKTIAVALSITRMVDPTHIEIAAKATYTPTAAIGLVVVNETVQMPIGASAATPVFENCQTSAVFGSGAGHIDFSSIPGLPTAEVANAAYQAQAYNDCDMKETGNRRDVRYTEGGVPKNQIFSPLNCKENASIYGGSSDPSEKLSGGSWMGIGDLSLSFHEANDCPVLEAEKTDGFGNEIACTAGNGRFWLCGAPISAVYWFRRFEACNPAFTNITPVGWRVDWLTAMGITLP